MELSKAISRINSSGGTDINLGVSFGFDELYRYENKHCVKQLYLFSDGNPTSGEKNWISIRKNIADRIRNGIILSTFAFGSDANNYELNALAGIAGGSHLFVGQETPEMVKEAINEGFKRRDYLAAINIQLLIEIDRSIPIMKFYGHDLITDPLKREAIFAESDKLKNGSFKKYGVEPMDDLINEEKGIRIFVPDLAIDEIYYICFELFLDNKNQLGVATIQYVDIYKKNNVKVSRNLNFKSELPAKIVVQHGISLWSSEIVFYALQDLYQKDMQTAQQRILDHLKIIESIAPTNNYKKIKDDCVTFKKFLSIARNLGKLRAVSDIENQHATLTYGLNAFGEKNSGHIKVKY